MKDLVSFIVSAHNTTATPAGFIDTFQVIWLFVIYGQKGVVLKSGKVKMLKPLPKGNGNPNIVIEAPDKVIIKYFMNSN